MMVRKHDCNIYIKYTMRKAEKLQYGRRRTTWLIRCYCNLKGCYKFQVGNPE
uniref:Uncharacterized protein n=1 Tax=Ciona intestinalis TaxID=7719 RepID=H2XQK6_CIOIN